MENPHHTYISEVLAQAANFRLQARQAHTRNQAQVLKISEQTACICRIPLGNLPGVLELDAVSLFEAAD